MLLGLYYHILFHLNLEWKEILSQTVWQQRGIILLLFTLSSNFRKSKCFARIIQQKVQQPFIYLVKRAKMHWTLVHIVVDFIEFVIYQVIELLKTSSKWHFFLPMNYAFLSNLSQHSSKKLITSFCLLLHQRKTYSG